jgi:hypothetical protein
MSDITTEPKWEVVWASKYRKTKIITARDMSKKEKQFYKRKKR